MPPKKPSTEVAPVAYALPPALANTPALDIGGTDIALPKVYVGQHMSTAVQEQLVAFGSIFTATGGDDPDPNQLWKIGDKPETGPLFHVIALKKGKSITVDGELVTYAFDDPDAPEDAWVTYQYVICLPEVDPDLPYKWLMTKTSAPAAKGINLLLKQNEAAGNPTYTLAFRATTAQRENKKGKFSVVRTRQVEADPANVAKAEALAIMIASAPTIERESTPSTQPAI